MKEKNKLSIKEPEVLFLSFFGVGFVPYAPGTFGTLATLPFLYLISVSGAPIFFFIPFIIVLTVISCFIAHFAQVKYNLHDPSWIVMDETIGMAISWLFLMGSSSIFDFIAIFVLFRFFDIIKIWPANYFDQNIKHGAGTILDDVISGIYAGFSFKVLSITIHYLL